MFSDDEIRQNEGFKNVALGNVIPASLLGRKMCFLSPEDEALLVNKVVASFEVFSDRPSLSKCVIRKCLTSLFIGTKDVFP